MTTIRRDLNLTAAGSRERFPEPWGRAAGLTLSLALLLSALPSARSAEPGASSATTKPKAAGKPAAPAKPPAKPAAKPTPEDPTDSFFRDGVIPRLHITIPDAELKELQQKNRDYVRCTIVEGDNVTYNNVGIHLKGSAGSFRNINDRPALTVKFDKFDHDQHFHGLEKLHLNNSVQDPTFLNELLSSDLFRAAGYPAARVSHARVWLNGRELGLYVLIVGFNKAFLKRNGLDKDGNLYEGGFVQDIDGQSRLESGNGPADRSDIKAVIEACRLPDPAKRWQRVEQLVDIDKMLTFIAMERLNCHWDGYTQNRNNYRFYFDPKTGKMQFIPHGMDQMFGDPNFDLLGMPGTLVPNAVLGNPEWRARYRDRLSELQKLFVPVDPLLQRVETYRQQMRPVLVEMGGNHANDFDQQVKGLVERLKARSQSIARQNAVVEARPLTFNASGVALLTRWDPQKDTNDSITQKIDAGVTKGAPASLTVAVGPSARCVASWRSKILLTAGKYRFEARARAEGVKAETDASGAGAGIRLSGGQRTQKLEGTTDWTPLTYEFQVQAPTQELILVAELRATAGKVTFDAGSLRLVRVP